MKNEEFEKAVIEIKALGDGEIGILFKIVYEEMCKREAKKIILRLIDEQK